MLFFWRPSGTCPEAIGRVSRHLRMALACLLDPLGPPEIHPETKYFFSFFSPPDPTTVNLNATIFLQNQSLNEQTGPGNRVSNINTWRKSKTGPMWGLYLRQLAPFSTNGPTYARRYLKSSFPCPLYYSSRERYTFCSTSHYGCMYIPF